MILDYVARDWAVQIAFVIVVGVLIFAAMAFRKAEQSDERQKQREREREMLIEQPKLLKKISEG